MIMMKFFVVQFLAALASAFVASAWSTNHNSLSAQLSRRKVCGRSSVPPFVTPKLRDGHRAAKKGHDEPKKGKGRSENKKPVRQRKTGSKGDDKTHKPKAGGKTTTREPEPHGVAQVPLPVSTPWEWEPVSLEKYPSVQTYLSRKVDAEALPEKVGDDTTYPGLILDGASGVGKTQQTLALLNHGMHKVVYLLLLDLEKGADRRQAIYREMIQITNMTDFPDILDAARKAVLVKAMKADDPFGVNYLSERLEKNLAPLDDLIEFFADRVLMYDQDRKILSRTVLTSRKRTVKDSIKRLAGTVLFLDEVLPPSTSHRDPSEEALSRLCFLRNLGRALGMRVVLAGTAATAANMISLRNKSANAAQEASRGGPADRGWMEIQFLWSKVQLPALLGPDVLTEHEERPYLLSLLEKTPEGKTEEKNIMVYLADTIDEDKKFSDAGKLIWLSGCWLASESEIMPSPFPMTPADLVKNHFFEPALAVSNEVHPNVGEGNTRRTRKTGPLRIVLQRRKHQDNIWWVLAPQDMKAGLLADFTRIESALTHCVQVCLAMEPILAVCLSISHKLAPDAFRKAFSELCKESPQQRTVGASDGELNEHLLFAALQLACRTNFPKTRTAAAMVERLWGYLSATEASPPPVVIEDFETILGCNVEDYFKFFDQENLDYSYGFLGDGDEDGIKIELHKTEMPWLVPACSHRALRETIMLTQSGRKPLFQKMKIAGLVPGETKNSSFDASAYLWESEDGLQCAPLEWTFEFKSRSGPYSITDASKDLQDKCTRFTKEHKEGKPKFNSMLVALTGSMKSECRIWLDDDKLRIVLLVGSGLLLPRWT